MVGENAFRDRAPGAIVLGSGRTSDRVADEWYDEGRRGRIPKKKWNNNSNDKSNIFIMLTEKGGRDRLYFGKRSAARRSRGPESDGRPRRKTPVNNNNKNTAIFSRGGPARARN